MSNRLRWVLCSVVVVSVTAGCASRPLEPGPETPVTTTAAGTSSTESSTRTTAAASEPDSEQLGPPSTTTGASGDTDHGDLLGPVIPVVDAPAALQPLEQERSARLFDPSAAGRDYAVVNGRELFPELAGFDAIHEAVVIRLSDGAVVARYAPPSRDRVVSRVYFYQDFALLLVATVNEGVGAVSPAAWAIRIDLTTGDEVNLTSTLPAEAAGLSYNMAVVDGQLVIPRDVFASGEFAGPECFTAVDIVTAAARSVGCAPDGLAATFTTPTARGVSYQTFDPAEAGNGCTHRYLIDLETGEHHALDTGDFCHVWDGLEQAGWQVWTAEAGTDRSAPDFTTVTVFARSSEGVVSALGHAKPLTMFGCGADVYYVTALDESAVTSLVRWQPGASSAERVFSIDASQQHLRYPTCTEGVVTVGYWNNDAPAVPNTAYFPAGT